MSAEPNVVVLTPEEIEAKLYTLRSDREEWDRLADTYKNYWRLTDEISKYEWLLDGDDHYPPTASDNSSPVDSSVGHAPTPPSRGDSHPRNDKT